MEPEFTRRRKFLNYLLGTRTGATLVAMFYPVIKFVIPPQVIEATQNSVTAGKVTEFVANSGKIIKFGNKPVLLVPFLDRPSAQGKSNPAWTISGLLIVLFIVVMTVYGYLD